MQQLNIPIGTLVDMYKRGELRLPEIQRHIMRRAEHPCGLSDTAFSSYPNQHFQINVNREHAQPSESKEYFSADLQTVRALRVDDPRSAALKILPVERT